MSLIVLINFHFAAKCTIIRAWGWMKLEEKLSHYQIYSSTHFSLQFLGNFLSVKFGMFLINEKFIAFCDSPQNKKNLNLPIDSLLSNECRFLDPFSSQSYFASTTSRNIQWFAAHLYLKMRNAVNSFSYCEFLASLLALLSDIFMDHACIHIVAEL